MNNNNVSDRGKNKNDLFTKITKNSLPNLLFRKKKWQIIRDQSHSSQNILHNNISDNHNKPINLQMQKLKTSNNLDDTNFHKNKKNRIWIINKYNYKIKNFQNFMENDKKTQTSNENEEKNNIEPILLMEIEEIKKELEKNESTFIYNQKLILKQLEEK
jgi:PAB1-binding protein PBP1